MPDLGFDNTSMLIKMHTDYGRKPLYKILI